MKRMKRSMQLFLGVALAALLAGGAYYAVPHGTSVADTEEMDEEEKVQPVGPQFDTDTAYSFIRTQCDFGPRTMNSYAHSSCENWIVEQFQRYGCKVTRQKAELRGYDGTKLHSVNIIASTHPEATTRILLCAHWDSRPWADNDPDSTKWHTPVMAANDGASGVAVMLELARLLQAHPLPVEKQSNAHVIGIDFVCFDAEDYGTPQWSDMPDSEDTWALGAQYWSTHLPQGYEARYGILLDMVGGQGARFYQELVSKQMAPNIVKKVWRAARQAGYGSYFPKSDGGAITDDHIPVNRNAKIPTIDVIAYYPDCSQSSFGPTWHTVSDDVQHIDKAVLKAVGQTLVQVLYTEQ